MDGRLSKKWTIFFYCCLMPVTKWISHFVATVKCCSRRTMQKMKFSKIAYERLCECGEIFFRVLHIIVFVSVTVNAFDVELFVPFRWLQQSNCMECNFLYVSQTTLVHDFVFAPIVRNKWDINWIKRSKVWEILKEFVKQIIVLVSSVCQGKIHFNVKTVLTECSTLMQANALL